MEAAGEMPGQSVDYTFAPFRPLDLSTDVFTDSPVEADKLVADGLVGTFASLLDEARHLREGILENDDLDIRFAVGKPGEEFSPIDQLSAGQRCTAVFPILLELRDGPLVVDQPEDNLDNRHIAKNVAVVLASDKRTRQIVMTSHNANLVVLSDPECIVTFEGAAGQGFVSHAGFLSHRGSSITSHVLDILDGGERALELRTKKYGKQT